MVAILCHHNDEFHVDAELRVEIDNHSGSMGVEPYLGYEMRAMQYKENNENNKHHDDERER